MPAIKSGNLKKRKKSRNKKAYIKIKPKIQNKNYYNKYISTNKDKNKWLHRDLNSQTSYQDLLVNQAMPYNRLSHISIMALPQRLGCGSNDDEEDDGDCGDDNDGSDVIMMSYKQKCRW